MKERFVIHSALVNLVSEPFGFDTISQQELDEAIRQWRIK